MKHTINELASWYTYSKVISVGVLHLLLGIVILLVSDWAYTYIKVQTGAFDVVIISDASVIVVVLAITCMSVAASGRVFGYPWYLTAIVYPVILCGFLLGYGSGHGLLMMSWEALQSVLTVADGKHVSPYSLLFATAIIGAAFGTLWVSPQQGKRRLLFLAGVPIAMMFVGLFLMIVYGQMKCELNRMEQNTHRRIDSTMARPINQGNSGSRLIQAPPRLIEKKDSRNN